MTSRFVLPLADVGAGINPSAGAKLYFYETGTTTPKNTFSDSAGTVPNANPVVANALGVFPDIYITGDYKVVLKTSDEVQFWSADPVSEFGASGGAASTQSIKEYDSFSAAVAATGAETIRITKGYYSTLPGFGASVYIKTTETGTVGVNDLGGYFIGTDGFKWVLLHKGYVGYTQFGADPTGVADSWQAIYNCHDYANTNKTPVKQNSGSFYIAARATAPFSIPVKTNWDMAGAKIVLRQLSTYPATDFIYLFEVESYKTPYALSSSEITTLNTTNVASLKKDSTKLPTSIFSAYKNAAVALYGQTDVTRSTGATVQKIELGVMADNGGLQQPLAKDFTDGLVSATVYPADENRLVINSPCWELAGVGDVRAVMIRNRHNVTVKDGVVVETVAQPATTSRRTFFAATGCYDIEWNNIRGEAWTQTDPPEGLYLFGGNIGVNWRYINCIGTHGWGASGMNYLKNVTFRDCSLNRYDIHWAGYDILIDNCELHNWGVLASGGNDITIRNCRYYLANSSSVVGDSAQYSVFQTRIDYGAEWDGNITVDGLEIVIGSDFTNSWSKDLSVVKFPVTSTPTNYGRDMILGRTINVRNVTIRLDDPARYNTIGKPWIMVDYEFSVNTSNNYYIAHTINVDNCSIAKELPNMAIMAYQPPKHYADQVKAQSTATDIADGDYNQIVNISRINNNKGLRTTLANTKLELVKFGGDLSAADAGWAARTDAIRPLINIDECNGVSAAIAVNGNVNITNSEVLVLDDVANTRPSTLYVNCDNCRMRMLDNGSADYLLPMKLAINNSTFYKARTSTGAVHTLDFAKWAGSTGYEPVKGTGNKFAPGFLYNNATGSFFDPIYDVETITGTAYTLKAHDNGKTFVFTSNSAAVLTMISDLPIGYAFWITKPTATGDLTSVKPSGEVEAGGSIGITAAALSVNLQMKKVVKVTSTFWMVQEHV